MEAHTFTRFIAFIIDLFILSVVLSLLTFWIPKSDKYLATYDREEELYESYKAGEIDSNQFMNGYFENSYVRDKENEVISIISYILSLGYFGTFVFYNDGQTLGKKLMKIKIVSSEDNKLNHVSLIIRSLIINGVLSSFLSCIIIFLISKDQYIYTIGVLQVIQSAIMISSALMVAFRNDKRGLHDLIAKTKVVQA